MIQSKINAITTAVLSLAALEGTNAAAAEIVTATATPDFQGVLSVILQIIVAASTLFKLFKKEPKKAVETVVTNSENVNG
jgi:hypothetical protein